MPNFLDLPAEVRLMVYQLAFENAAVKFAPRTSDTDLEKRATAASLMICHPTIYRESQILFFQLVRIDIDNLVDDSGPEVAPPVNPELVWHVKFSIERYESKRMQTYVKKMKNLKSLMYTTVKASDVQADWWQKQMESPEETAEHCIEMVVRGDPELLTGHYCCRSSWDTPATGETLAIWELLSAWKRNDRPFKVVGEIGFWGTEAVEKMVSYIDLGTQLMTVVHGQNREHVLAEFMVDRLDY